MFANRRVSKLSTAISDYLQTKYQLSGQFSIDEKNKVIRFGFACEPLWPALKEALDLTDWQFITKISAHAVKAGLKPHPQIHNVIAVASGKGGVGKSTVAVNLALALNALGAKVGMLDADIYGPSQPLMLGKQGSRPEGDEQSDTTGIPPVIALGLQSSSIGYMLAQEDSPAIWRGPMATRALEQLFNQTHWSNLDYLIIDMPPGTGDIPLTLSQKIPVTAAVIVTTPQDIALIDAKKAVKMFEKVAVPVAGVVENMAGHVCTQCGHHDPIFGEKGGESMARDYELTLLAQLPLDRHIREQADSGRPTVLASPESDNAQRFSQLALKLSANLSLMKKDYTAKFGQISVTSE